MPCIAAVHLVPRWAFRILSFRKQHNILYFLLVFCIYIIKYENVCEITEHLGLMIFELHFISWVILLPLPSWSSSCLRCVFSCSLHVLITAVNYFREISIYLLTLPVTDGIVLSLDAVPQNYNDISA